MRTRRRIVGQDVTPESILIVKPSSLGDVVHTLPAVARVKGHWPDAHLRWVINPEWAPLLEGNRNVDELIIFPRKEFRGIGGLVRFAGWIKDLRKRVRADLVLDFQCLLRSGLISKACRKPGGYVAGLSDAREGARFFYNEVADVRGRDHAVDRYLALVEALGIRCTLPLEWPLPAGSSVAGVSPGFILFHPFSRGAGKSLEVQDVMEFCSGVAPFRVVIAGRSEQQIPEIGNAVNLLNQTTLGELIWLIRNAAYTVSVDSGPMHIAAAITGQLLSIHTWSDPLKVGPYRSDAMVWKEGDLASVSAWRSGAAKHTVEPIHDIGVWVKNQASGYRQAEIRR